MQERLLHLILFYPVFLFSLSVHEAAHGWMAEKFGDRTARLMGRVTLSPFPHLDLIGTVALPIFGILSGLPIIGWGKPVPVDSRFFTHPRQDQLWVAAIGPASNLLLAVLFAMALWGMVLLLPRVDAGWFVPGSFGATAVRGLFSIFQMGVILNLILAFFNLLPLPPLDGGSIVRGILPEGMVASFDDFSRYGFLILLLLFATGMLKYILVPVYAVAALLLP